MTQEELFRLRQTGAEVQRILDAEGTMAEQAAAAVDAAESANEAAQQVNDALQEIIETGDIPAATVAKVAEHTVQIGNLESLIFDISANNPTEGHPTPYANLAAALGEGGVNVPESLRKGGMSVKFIQGNEQSSDNKYVQYSLIKDEWSTNVNDWQGITQDIKQNSQSIRNIQSSVMTDEDNDTFYVTDSNGNVIAKIDENGVKAVDYLDKNGVSLVNAIASKVDKIVGKGLSTNDFTNELKDKVENNISEQVIDLHDEFYIADKNGNVAFSVDNSGNVKYNQKNSIQCGNIFSLCDSLGTLGVWQSRSAQFLGMSFDNSINRDNVHPLSVGGSQTNLDDYGTLNRAKSLVEYWVGEQNKKVDVLLIENINDTAINMAILGQSTDKPWMLSQTIKNTNIQESAVAAEVYFEGNIATILSGVTKQYGTLIQIPYTSGSAKRITVTSVPTQDGSIVLNFSGVRYTINVQSTNTIQEVVEKIAEIDYTDVGYSVLREAGGTSVLFTRHNGDRGLEIQTNTTGAGITVADTTGVAYNGYAYDGSTLEDSDWLNNANWKKQYITSQIISRYSLYKGLMDYLTSNLRSTKIYFVIAPRLTAQMNTTYKGDDGLIDYDSFDEDREDYITCVNMQIEVCRQYGIPVLDMRTESGINICNSPYFYDPQDGASGVHCGRRGYLRIGETIARLLN